MELLIVDKIITLVYFTVFRLPCKVVALERTQFYDNHFHKSMDHGNQFHVDNLRHSL